MSNSDCLVPLHELVVQLPPFHSLDALVGGLADGVPVLVHKRWSPSAVHHVGVDEGAQHTFFTSSNVNSPTPSGMTAFGNISLEV